MYPRRFVASRPNNKELFLALLTTTTLLLLTWACSSTELFEFSLTKLFVFSLTTIVFSILLSWDTTGGVVSTIAGLGAGTSSVCFKSFNPNSVSISTSFKLISLFCSDWVWMGAGAGGSTSSMASSKLLVSGYFIPVKVPD